MIKYLIAGTLEAPGRWAELATEEQVAGGGSAASGSRSPRHTGAMGVD